MSLRKSTRDQIIASIAAQTVPRPPRSGVGLVLPDGRRRKVLYNSAGQVTKAGEFYYAQPGAAARPAGNFDFTQQPYRKGRSQMIKLLDGTQKAVSTFDPVEKVFKPTAIGRTFFKHRTDRYVILFPATVDMTRKNGSIYSREGDYMPSTASDLGEIEVSVGRSQ